MDPLDSIHDESTFQKDINVNSVSTKQLVSWRSVGLARCLARKHGMLIYFYGGLTRLSHTISSI